MQISWKTFQTKIIGRKFVRNVGILTVANLVGAILSFIQGILVARWLGPGLYGIAALVMSYPALIYTFFDARSAEASVKYLSEFHARGEWERAIAMCKLGYVVDLAIALLAFMVVIITAPWAAEKIAHHPEMAWLVVIYAAALVPRAFTGTSQAVLTSLGYFNVIACVSIVVTLVRVVLVLSLVLFGLRVSGVVVGNAIAATVMGVLYGIVAYKTIKRTGNISWLKGSWKALKGRRREILGFLAYNDLNAFFGMISKQLDLVLLGYFRNPQEVGYYKLAKSISAIAGYVVKPLQSVIYPELARLWGLGDKQAIRNKIRRLAFQVGAPLGLVALTGTLLIPSVLHLLVGPAYKGATLAAQILLIGSAVWLAFFWLRPLFLAQGAIKTWTIIMSSVVMLLLAGFMIITPIWGLQGMALWLTLMQVLGHCIAAIWIFLHQNREAVE